MPFAWVLLLYVAAAEAQFSGLPGLEAGAPASVPLLAVSGFGFGAPYGSSYGSSYDSYGPSGSFEDAASSEIVPDVPDEDDGGYRDAGQMPLHFPKNAQKIPGFTADMPGLLFDYTTPVLNNMISAANNNGGPSSSRGPGGGRGAGQGGSIQGYRLPTLNFGMSETREREYQPQSNDNNNNNNYNNNNNNNNFNGYNGYSSYGSSRQQHRFGPPSSGFQSDYQSQSSQSRPSFGDYSFRQFQSPPPQQQQQQQQHQQQAALYFGGFGDLGSGRPRGGDFGDFGGGRTRGGDRGGDFGRFYGGRAFQGGRPSEAFSSRPGNGGGRMRGFGGFGGGMGMGNRRHDVPITAPAQLQRRLGLPAPAPALPAAQSPSAPPPTPLHRHAYRVDVEGDGFGYRYAVETSRGGSPLAFTSGRNGALHVPLLVSSQG